MSEVLFFFIRQAVKKEGSARFEILVSAFFLGLGVGTRIEVIT